MTDVLKTGSDVICYCGACKMDINHVILAMDGTKIAKVECKTCHATHTYKGKKGIKAPKKVTRKAPSKRAEKKAQDVLEAWNDAMGGSGFDKVPYSIRSTFEVGSKIDHKKYGPGVVQNLIHPDKVEVLFKDDVRVLLHSK